MKKRIVAALLAAVMGAAALTGCGGSGSTSQNNDASAEAEAGAEDASAADEAAAEAGAEDAAAGDAAEAGSEDLLAKIQSAGKIVIAITHTPDRVADLFDQVIVLARDSGRVGRLAFYGSPAQAREFFGKETMEGVVMSISSKEEGGDGRADEMIERYANLIAEQKEGAAS